jgi:hypothetical protein
VLLMNKNRSKKSRASVPLIRYFEGLGLVLHLKSIMYTVGLFAFFILRINIIIFESTVVTVNFNTFVFNSNFHYEITFWNILSWYHINTVHKNEDPGYL